MGGGRYDLQRELGSGEFGTVHLATDLDEGGDVAVKTFKEGVTLDEALLEAQLQRRLSAHDRIVPLRNVDARTGPSPIVITEYRPDGSVAARIGNGPAGLLLGYRWTLDVADGLVHAHANDIFHRDAKPSNLLLDGTGHAALCDFGVAEDNLTGEGSSKVYPHLIAPEMPDAGTSEATEVWMLGALAYRLLVGEYPFPFGGYGLTGGTVVQPHLTNPQIPMALSRVLQDALAVDPADRHQGVDAMRKALLAANPVTEFVEAPGGEAIARWKAKVRRGVAVVEVVPTARSTFTARIRLDQGSGPRTVDSRPARSSPGLALRDARTYLHAVVEGRAP